MEEEKRKQIDKEEAEYRQQQMREAIEKAKTQMYYQTDHVKGFNVRMVHNLFVPFMNVWLHKINWPLSLLQRALLLTEVLKEREAQIELKQKIQSASIDEDKKFIDMAQIRDDEALRKEEEKALVKKLERKAVAEDLENQ